MMKPESRKRLISMEINRAKKSLGILGGGVEEFKGHEEIKENYWFEL